MAKSESHNAFRIQRSMMTASGVWPVENPLISYKLRGFLSWTFAISLCVTMWMETISDIKDFAKLSEIVYIMITITAYIIKLSVFTYKRQKFLKTIRFLQDPIFTSYEADLDHYMATTVKYSTLLANLYRYLVGCCVVLYIFYPILDNKPLPFPFPYDTGRYRILMYTFQLVGESYAAWNNSCLDTLCTSLMGIGAAQLDILHDTIVHLGENTKLPDEEIFQKKEERMVRELRKCVEHHLAIISFIESVEDIFTIGLLAQTVASVLVICNTVFHFILITISSQFFMLADYLMILMIQLFIYCWYGNEIIIKSEKIGQACYHFKWTSYGMKVRKYLFIMMERSKRPINITAVGLFSLSLTSYVSVLRWSYSCLALLLKMYQDKTKSKE